MYDISKMIFVEESSKGYTVRLTRTDNQTKVVSFHPFSEKEHVSLTRHRAEIEAGNLMNNLLDILQEVSGKDMPDQEVLTIKANW